MYHLDDGQDSAGQPAKELELSLVRGGMPSSNIGEFKTNLTRGPFPEICVGRVYV